MPDLVDRHLVTFIVNEIDDPVSSLSQPVAISVAREFFQSLGSGVRRQGPNLVNDALTIGIGADRLKLFPS